MKAISIIIISLSSYIVTYSQMDLSAILQLSQSGKYELAEEQFVLIEGQEEKETIKARAFNYSWWGKYELAELAFLDLLKQDKGNVEGFAGLAYNYRYAGNYAKSNQYFNILLNHDANNLSALKGLIYNYLDTDKLDGVAHYLKKAKILAPSDKELFYTEGLLALKKQDFSGAQNAFKKSLEFDGEYQPAQYQLSRMLTNPAKWEISPWIGLSYVDEMDKLGLRRLDVFYNASSKLLFYGFWDNSLSFENNILLRNGQQSFMTGIGVSGTWNDNLNTNFRASLRDMGAQADIWDIRLEQNLIITDGWRIQLGGQVVFDHQINARVLSLSNEIRLSKSFNLEATIFNTYNFISENYENTYLIVPKIYLGKNIEMIAGGIFDDIQLEGSNAPFRWRGIYSMLSFPITSKLYSRIFYLQQEDVANQVKTISLGLSIKI